MHTAMRARAGGRGTMWYCWSRIWHGSQLCCQTLRLNGSILSSLNPEYIHLWGCQRDGVRHRKPRCGQQRLSGQQRTCHSFPLANFTSACLSLSPTLRVALPKTSGMTKPLTLVSGKQSLGYTATVQKARRSDLCKPPRQSPREEAKLVLPQNNGCVRFAFNHS